MEFKAILSGKEKIQILDHGFRLKHNKGPSGPYKTTYFTCVYPGCKARAATTGELALDKLTLKYHHIGQHSHHADASSNLVAEKLYQFRKEAKENPKKTAKSIYKKLVKRHHLLPVVYQGFFHTMFVRTTKLLSGNLS